MDWTLVPIFLAIGGVVGFIAGLLGMAHRWPVARLRRAFGALLYVVAAFFLWKVFAH